MRSSSGPPMIPVIVDIQQWVLVKYHSCSIEILSDWHTRIKNLCYSLLEPCFIKHVGLPFWIHLIKLQAMDARNNLHVNEQLTTIHVVSKPSLLLLINCYYVDKSVSIPSCHIYSGIGTSDI